jgi:putative phosphoribosyl transferase
VIFRDRRHAGLLLGARLEHLRDADPVVLALPRGGVPVAAEVAGALGATLDVLIVRKIGSPTQPELALGAIGEGDARVVNRDLVARVGASAHDLAAVEERERAEIDRRRVRYRHGRPMVDISGRAVVLVDDGLATGATVRAAIAVVRAKGAARVIVAVPVGAPDSLRLVARDADEVIALSAPPTFSAVGAWYADFGQVDDAEVERLLT